VTPFTINASSVRLPEVARAALENHRDVQVVVHRRPRYVLVNADDYALISPLLDRVRRGAPVPIEDLLDDDDFAIIAELEAEDEGLLFGALEAQPEHDAGS
jgi:PHD/YefM family antitoxin component YafN of YafNO toxin-antitoxin module